MKRKLACLLISLEVIIILFNTSLEPFLYIVNAVDDVSDLPSEMQDAADNTTLDDVENTDGEKSTYNVYDKGVADTTSQSGTNTVELKEVASGSDTIAGITCALFMVLPLIANAFMATVTMTFQPDFKVEYKARNEAGEIITKNRILPYFLIEDLVMNRYKLFDIDYLDVDDSSNDTIDVLRKNVAIWYYSLRNVAIVANCLILVYIGIRMAISTVVDDRVKYKKMFIKWLTSVVLIYLMHYILAIIFVLQGFLVDLIANLPIIANEGFEEYIMNNVISTLVLKRGWDMFAYTVTLYIIVYYQLKFFLMYFKRTLSIGFLFAVSPLITITYAIDAVKDGKSQVFTRWFKEVTYNVFIQVIHAVVYAVFIISAGNIAKHAPLMGAVLIITLSRAEKIIEKTFKLSSKITRSESLLDKIKQLKPR